MLIEMTGICEGVQEGETTVAGNFSVDYDNTPFESYADYYEEPEEEAPAPEQAPPAEDVVETASEL